MRRIRNHKHLVDEGLIGEKSDFISVATGNPTDTRNSMVIDVLCKLPDEAYQTIKERHVWFFAPALGVNGWNGQIPSNKSQVIYLAPYLEQRAQKECLLIVAHEIMHCLLDHAGSPSTIDMENEAWSKVVQLGFGTDDEIITPA